MTSGNRVPLPAEELAKYTEDYECFTGAMNIWDNDIVGRFLATIEALTTQVATLTEEVVEAKRWQYERLLRKANVEKARADKAESALAFIEKTRVSLQACIQGETKLKAELATVTAERDRWEIAAGKAMDAASVAAKDSVAATIKCVDAEQALAGVKERMTLETVAKALCRGAEQNGGQCWDGLDKFNRGRFYDQADAILSLVEGK